MKACLSTACCVGLLLSPGCGSDSPEGGVAAGLPLAGGGGAVTYVLPSLPLSLDPLAAASLEAQIVTRQVHEPLVTVVAAPYGGERQRMGLATALRPSSDRTVWTVQLRPGVRFQDGSPFNAAAVVANSRRWASLPEGRALLPDLFAVDAPRPGEVRFQLQRSVPGLPKLLADPRLGIVSPQALDRQRGEGSRFRVRGPGTGTGPFQPASRAQGLLELARNPAWWGSPLGLGPALDTVNFERVPAVAARAGALRAGEAQIAGPLPPAVLGSLDADPLLSAESEVGGGVGTEASVRGLNPALSLPLLSGVWLTTLPD